MNVLGYIAVSVMLGGSSGHAPPNPIPEDVQIAAFKSEVPSHKKDFVLCLRVNESNPPPAVLSAVASDERTIVAGSECEEVMDVNKGSFHRASGRPAMFLSLSGFREVSASHAELGLVSYHHGLWAEGVKLFLERTASGWVVSKRQHEWVS
jgi:hypothetical protein